MTHIYTYWEGWILVNMYRTHLMREGGGPGEGYGDGLLFPSTEGK